MIIAFFDNCGIVEADVIRTICAELNANAVNDFGLTPLHSGDGPKNGKIARECKHCGAILGSLDPYDAQYVMLGNCGCRYE